MEVAMVGAIAGPAFKTLLDILVSAAIEEIKREFGFEEVLDKLQNSADMLDRLLSDSQNKLVGSAVGFWLNKLEDSASRANSILREIIQKKEEKIACCCFTLPCGNLHLAKRKLARQMEEVLESLEKINKPANEFGLQFQLANASHISTVEQVTLSGPQTESFSVESNVVRGDSGGSEHVQIQETEETTVVSVIPYYDETESGIPVRVKDVDDAKKANLFGKKNFCKLVFRWNESRVGEISDEDVLEALQPHPDLEYLEIIGYKGRNFPSWGTTLKKLIKIKLQDCSRCIEIPVFACFPNLESLSIIKCGSLIKLPEGLDTLEHLEIMKIVKCKKLKSISYGSGQSRGLKSLKELKIQKCKLLTNLPSDLLESCSSSLEFLSIYGLKRLTNFDTLGPFISKMSNLKVLRIYRHPKFIDLPKDLSCLRSLNKLSLGVFKEPLGLGSLNYYLSCIFQNHWNSLEHLELVAENQCDSLPDQIQNLTGLTILELRDFTFQALPEWLGNMSSLQELWVTYCQKLERLPSMEAVRRLANLRNIDFETCPLIEERCSEQQSTSSHDSEFLKISHIKTVQFNRYELSYGKYLPKTET